MPRSDTPAHALTDAQIAQLQYELPHWVLEQGRALARELVFADFVRAMAFMNAVAVVAEEHNHHPEWSNVYNRVRVVWTTHDTGGLSDKDIVLAKLCDAAYVAHSAKPAASPDQPSKHGLAAGTPVQPMRPDWTIDQGWQHYTAAEHAVWRTLFERQRRLLPQVACGEFVAGLDKLPITADAIPDFRALSEVLMQQTGWQVVAVPGLVPDAVFFEHLANRRFPSGNFIRSATQLDYLEEPDVFHDVFGHTPMLMHPVMADFIQAYGQAGLRAQRIGKLDVLARVYWYTVEFGLVQQSQGLRIYGAGIASSYTESLFSIHDASPNRIGFDLERVMRTEYRIDDFQQSYFVLENLDKLLELARIDFDPFYAKLDHGAIYQPAQVLPSDQVLHRGSQAYHHAKQPTKATAQP